MHFRPPVPQMHQALQPFSNMSSCIAHLQSPPLVKLHLEYTSLEILSLECFMSSFVDHVQA